MNQQGALFSINLFQ